MPTYGDVTALVRALLDDQPAAWADDTFLIKFVNAAQRRLVSDLSANSVERLRFRLHTVIYVPAGTTSLSNVMSMAPSNDIPHSDRFTYTGADAAADTWGIWTPTYSGPTAVLAGQADPFGTTTAYRWTCGAGLAAAVLGYTVLSSTAPGYVTSAIWLKADPATGPLNATMWSGDGVAAGPYTGRVKRDFNMPTEWERYSLTTDYFTASGTSRGALFLSVAPALNANFYLARAKIELSQFDSGDVMTNGFPAPRRPISLPANMLEPFALYERRVGGDDSEWLPMMGPKWLSEAVSTTTLRQWDWRGGEIMLLPATEDREVRLDFWGSLSDYQDPPNAAQPIPLADAVNALAFRVCEDLVRSRGRMDAAQEFERKANLETSNIITREVKARQAVPRRRRPFLGVPRYPATRYPNY